jgi:multiple sugar transport system ATP-binding protein
MVSMRVGGELVSIKTGKDYTAEIGQPISVSVPAHACHFFDKATGTRIAT